MAYTSKQSARDNQAAEESAVKQTISKQTAPAFSDQRVSTSVQLKQQQMMTAAQSTPLQRAEDEELLQGKFATTQLMEEEEPLQGKFATAQLAEEEEMLQGKFPAAQLMEEEEPLQGKFETAQLMEEEEPLQGKFEPLQRTAEEEEPLQGKFQLSAPMQLEQKPNNTGMPNSLKSGIENLSGFSMDDVKVHYNSDRPAQLNAHAYAQGTDIHVAPGQEQHLPHEAWHVVQQKQGRVQPTTQMKAGVPVNDDVGLESEADVMGAKAISTAASNLALAAPSSPSGAVQRLSDEDVTSKPDREKLKKIKDAYNAKLGVGKPLYNIPGVESFDYLFEKALSLEDLDARVKNEITKAEAQHARAQIPVPTPVVATPTPIVATPSPAPSVAIKAPDNSSGSAPPIPAKVKPKATKVDPSTLGFYSGPAKVQQAYEEGRHTSNVLIAQWIAAKPAGSTLTLLEISVSDDTVYIYIRLKLQQEGYAIPYHDMEIHYHPVPTSKNYLHVKARAGGDAGNIIKPTSWLVPAGALTTADSDWDAANPSKPSQKPRG